MRATGQTLAEQLERGIWRRIGTEFDASWSLDRRGGMKKAAVGLNATARDYTRFARLFVTGGELEGERILPAKEVVAGAIFRCGERPAPKGGIRLRFPPCLWLFGAGCCPRVTVSERRLTASTAGAATA